MRTALNDTGYKTFKANSAISLGCRVKLTAVETVDIAGATDAAIGTAMEDIASGGYGVIKLYNSGGTLYAKAGAAITAGTQLYPSAAGKVKGTGTTAIGYVALEPASADGDVILISRIEVGA